ncbi:MAG: SdrD B-like domain-containing protein [Blastocatellia bacterium]|nr:SdrD B-like domain-containing protein [Blastocatellia bacterium]
MSEKMTFLRAGRSLTWALLLATFAMGLGGMMGVSGYWRTRAASGTITGVVFQDFNGNGVRDAAVTITNNGAGTIGGVNDRGVAGVTVTAFDAVGGVAGTATTGATGSYSLTASGTGPYRVEFSNLPGGFQPGPRSNAVGTTVQFVSDGNTANVDLGLVLPAEFCQANPDLATGCYVFGPQTGNDETIVTFPYSSGTTRSTGPEPFTDYDSPFHGILGRANQVGSTWGLAYTRISRTLYAGAFMKKHTGFGPGGPGAIYKVDRNTNAVTVHANLNTLLGAGAAGNDPHDPNDYDRDNGNATWDAVGKLSFGGLAVSEDETKLYAMNLATRQLMELPVNAAPTAGNIRVKATPTNPPGCANAGDVRPFAVTAYRNRLYVGMVCSGESTVTPANPAGDAAALQAYVYTVDPASLEFSAAPVFQMPLNYPRRCTDSAQNGPGNCFSAAWRAWSPVFQNIGTEGRTVWPQPMLSTIEFDNGNLILGFRDRAGDQFGNETLDNPADGSRYYGVSAGDVIRACGSPAAGWTTESNGRCGGNGTAPQGTNEGPGGGEFYFFDKSIPFNDEVAMGAATVLPGYPDVAMTVFDPIPVFEGNSLFDGGVRWMGNTTGGYVKAYRVYDGGRTTAGPFGKANGLGALKALCEAAPIEVGNRLWRDLDGDGVQDANEAGIPGVTVALCAPDGATIATAVTDANGNFIFSSAAGTSTAAVIYGVTGLGPNTQGYRLKLSNPANFQPGGPLAGHTLSPMDAGNNMQDQRDSDAMIVSGAIVLPFNTGGPGANNHTFDIGFLPPAQQPTINCPASMTITATGPTGAIVTYPPPVVSPANATITCSPASGSTFPIGTTTVTCTATNGGLTASCPFTVTVTQPQPPTIVCPTPITAPATSASGAVVTYPAPVVTPDTATVSCSPASGSTFPVGTTTVTCTATNGALTASCPFMVTVTPQQQPPTITCPTPMTVPATSANGAIVTYPTPTVTPSTATVSCSPASGSSFPVGTTTVTCTATSGTLTASCPFTVTVAQATGADLAVTKTNNQTNYTPGQLVTYQITVINNGPGNVENAAVADRMPVNLQNISWTCQITTPGSGPGASACGGPSGTGDINTTLSLRSGGVASYIVRARVSASATGNLINTATVANPPNVTDPNPGNNRATDTDVKSSTEPPPPGTIGPGTPLPGASVLIYPVYTSSPTNTAAENTRISLTNTSPSQSASIHLFFVDGSTCAVADAYLCLTPNQTTSFLASDVDPGVTGYLIAVAVDPDTGCPTSFNHLIGDEYAKFASGQSGNLRAEGLPAIAPPACDGTQTAALNFDGVAYGRLPRALALDSVPSPRDGNASLLVIDRIGGNLATGVGTLGSLFGILYDDSESAFSFNIAGATCQVRQTLSANFPRTVPRFDTVIPAGRTGWMKLWPAAEIGVIGAMFNANANAATSSSAFTGGHGLHALTLQPSTSLTIPVFPPSC